MMAVLKFFLIMVEVISGLLLIGAVLVQKTRSQGMGMAFGSGMGESLFGAGVGNVLTKATVVLAIVFLANTTLLALLQSGKADSSVTEGIAPASPVPVAPATLPQQPPTTGTGPTETSQGTGIALPETTPAETAAPAVATPAPEATGPAETPQPVAPAEAAPAATPEPVVAP